MIYACGMLRTADALKPVCTHLRTRFMGLFATVASVGLAMSTHRVSSVVALIGANK